MAAPLGQLVAWNVVSTFKVRISPSEPLLNLNTVALACSGKYNPSVFPAVVCAARLPELGAGEVPVGECEYPLQPSRQKASASAAVVPAPRRKKKHSWENSHPPRFERRSCGAHGHGFDL
jgi:hypothetical protein